MMRDFSNSQWLQISRSLIKADVIWQETTGMNEQTNQAYGPGSRDAKLVTVFGGTGFLGRNLVRNLAKRGFRVRVALRDVESGKFLRTMGDPGQVGLVQANVRDDASVEAACNGADAVVNLVGILYQSGKNTFDAVHVEAAGRIASAAAKSGANNLVQVSALGASPEANSRYGRSKANGEEQVKAAFADATIVRPGILVGAEDHFFNSFGKIIALSPFMPLFARDLMDRQGASFQPVYVADVAEAITNSLDDESSRGQTYELGGDQVLSWRDCLDITARETQRLCVPVPIMMWIARFYAFFLELLPAPLLTRDQLRALEEDSVVSEGAKGLSDLGVEATPIEAVLPSYMARYRKPGRNPRLQTTS
jgi:uncharacterized protein YbjT (DUF2867 family)